MNNYKTCSFVGHRKISVSDKLIKSLTEKIESLILQENVKVFLFGSKSKFDSLCLDVVLGLEKKYPFIKK